MKKQWLIKGLLTILLLVPAACGSNNGGAEQANTTEPSEAAVSQPSNTTAGSAGAAEETPAGTRTLTFLDQEYSVPAKVERVVITGSLEAMEDALVLGVKPVGAISIAGKFPAIFEEITGEAESIGEKTEPNFEKILSLKPDVILGSSKFAPEVAEKLAKIGPTIPVSHISTNWEANLRLLGELTGKEAEAEQILSQYKSDLEAAKVKLADRLSGKKAVAVRVRGGNLFIYPETVFFNPSLYADLGLTVPEEIKAAKAQEVISIEKFSAMNPDYIFIQFSEEENADAPKALEDLQDNPIWNSIKAVKDGHVFVNAVDPLAQGGTAWSKIQFLKAASDKLSQ
ncbi:iron-uptake system-binding protein [Paenibacillus sambharensis]|uniref:Iron-uptake system-binding protein n=1 Tax=Paenibacillus sambharensis TaxID=1803190 RepID=A0A2W1L4C3_9BACL|nr:iron-hydroxamate ABC transporter substrate-binding protein [Paenibacillus sambharensis]PZD93739.1 iron-uptake system-binding protein [Paenibacillus sambharensis]